MVRHIVAWNFKNELSSEEKHKNAEQIRSALEKLKNAIPGIIEIKVIIDLLPTSNRDIVLNSLFESVQALAAYQIHPEHVHVSSYVGKLVQDRTSIDYYE